MADRVRIAVSDHVAEVALARPLAAARELAADVAAHSPDAVHAAKRLYDESWNAPVEHGLKLESELQPALIGSPNQLAAMRRHTK